MSCWQPILLYRHFFEATGGIRFSVLFNGLEDSCKHTYLEFSVSSLVTLLLPFVGSRL